MSQRVAKLLNKVASALERDSREMKRNYNKIPKPLRHNVLTRLRGNLRIPLDIK